MVENSNEHTFINTLFLLWRNLRQYLASNCWFNCWVFFSINFIMVPMDSWNYSICIFREDFIYNLFNSHAIYWMARARISSLLQIKRCVLWRSWNLRIFDIYSSLISFFMATRGFSRHTFQKLFSLIRLIFKNWYSKAKR